MKAKIFWRNSGTEFRSMEFESPEKAKIYMEQTYGMLWHVQYLLFVEVKPDRRPARRAQGKPRST